MNKRYEDGFYNEEVKKRYLETLENVKTKKTYKRILLRAKIIEDYYKKDLYNFNREEIGEVLTLLRPKNFATSRQNGYIIHAYIVWAIREGYRENNINPLDNVDTDYYMQFVDTEKEILFHEDKIYDIVDQCKNGQDKAPIMLLFEGAYGNEYSELLNLKTKDVDIENKILRLQDANGTERYLRISDRCLNAIRKAISETEYLKRNGEVKKELRAKITHLVENDYVLRPSKTNSKNEEGKADNHLILRRLDMLKKVLNIPYFTAMNIRKSGMLKMAKDLYIERGRLDKEELDDIGEKFGISINGYKDGKKEYNYYAYKQDFLNIETIKKIYG